VVIDCRTHRENSFEHRDEESERFARSRLSLGQDIVASESGLEGELLNLCRVLVLEHLCKRSLCVGVDGQVGEPRPGQLHARADGSGTHTRTHARMCLFDDT
jgi:hypothetical protein